MIKFKMIFKESDMKFALNVTSESKSFQTRWKHLQVFHEGEEYIGQTVYIPSQEEQTAQTAGKTLTENIIIRPIPNNYGKITWNGSWLLIE